MDVVYPLRVAADSSYHEFQYSLRTLQNLDHDKVFIVGGCPRWVTNVVHLPTDQKFSKYQNLCHNIEVACKSDYVSDPFLIMNDDFMIVELTEIQPHWRETVDEGIERYQNHSRMKDWVQPMMDVADSCQRLGIKDPVSYELHIPMVVQKQAMLDALALVPHGPVWRTMYGNLAGVGGTKIPDVKIYNRKMDIPDGPFVSTEDSVFPFGVAGKTVRKMFPEKSEYEVNK